MPRLIVRGYEGIELARASRFDALGIEYRTDVGLKQFKELLPLGALMGIIGPFPYEAFKRPEFIPFLLEGVAGNPDLNLPDGIHPTPEGHRIVMETLWPFISKAL